MGWKMTYPPPYSNTKGHSRVFLLLSADVPAAAGILCLVLPPPPQTDCQLSGKVAVSGIAKFGCSF